MRSVPDTPGARLANSAKLRVASGRLATESVATVNERSPLVAWMSGASPFTSTVSVVPPTSRVSAPTPTRMPALTVTPDRLSVLNDGISTWMV